MATFRRGLDYIKEIVQIGSNMGGLKTMLVLRRSPIALSERHRYFNLSSESEQLSELLNATTHLFGRKILINLDRATDDLTNRSSPRATKFSQLSLARQAPATESLCDRPADGPKNRSSSRR
ncbi:MAG: hypothetical protein GDA38_12950 [Hormoscilla sp. SP12CHS1]|nr:hypothetical protein [Hormoscilla sp. SP12CHS1]